MTFLLIAIASWVFWFAAGLLVGLYADDRRYRAPEHPVLRPVRSHRLRLVEGGKPRAPFDWQHEEGA